MPKNNSLAAKLYADLFGWRLADAEARLWAIKGSTVKIYRTRSSLKTRKTREKISQKKFHLAAAITDTLKKIPSIAAIFLTGSVAVGNATRGSDIDLMIVTRPGVLWLTRLVVFLLLKKKGLYKEVVCPNIFLDTDHLEITERNLYTAHEVLQAKCLFDRGGTNYLWLAKNNWTKNYLPNAYKFKIRNLKFKNLLEIRNWKLEIFRLLELPAFIFQYLYQLPKQTNEKLGWGYAFFHPRDLSEEVLAEFEKRLDKASGI